MKAAVAISLCTLAIAGPDRNNVKQCELSDRPGNQVPFGENGGVGNRVSDLAERCSNEGRTHESAGPLDTPTGAEHKRTTFRSGPMKVANIETTPE